MARVVLAEELHDDFKRILAHLSELGEQVSLSRIAEIVAAFDVLETSPLIGRPVEHGRRELVIGTGRGGSIALYQYVSELDVVFVLAVRAQREAGYRG